MLITPWYHAVVMTNRRVQIGIKAKLREELNRLKKVEVLKKGDKSTEWVTSLVEAKW